MHFEIIGSDPAKLREYYGELFGWVFDTGAAGESSGIPGGVGGGPGYDKRVIFYVGVPDVEAALRKAESLGGTRGICPEGAEGRDIAVGHFTDPEGNLVGVAGPA